MALPNNPTQAQVVKAVKDLENAMPTQITSIDGLAGGQLTSALYLSGGDAASGVANIQLDTNGQMTAKGTTSTLFGRSNSTTLLVGHSSHALTLRGSATRPTYNGNALALSSDIPSAVTESTVSGWGFTKNAGTITGVQLNGTSIASSGVANVQALPNYSLSIGSTNGGNPRQVLFMTVNYTNFDSNNGAYFKLGAMESHGNGSSYAFLEDIIIGVSYTGTVSCNVYKYVQSSVTLDSVARNYGDVFYTIDTTNKIVYFYILMGQYTSAQFTPATKIGATKAITSANGIVQKSGTPTYYSSGTKVWASGNSTTYARLSDIPSTSGLMPKSGGTFTGDVDWSGSSQWLKPYLLAFKNADTSSSPTYPYTGFYQWGAEWQVNARDANNTFVHNLLTINNSTKAATFTGSVSAPSFYAASDRRLKENIKPAELDCGKVIDDLQIKEFNFIDDEEKKIVVGAIAQELKEILPEKYRAELVNGSEDTHYSINEGKLLFIAIGALKEERAKTKELEERLARLEAKLGV